MCEVELWKAGGRFTIFFLLSQSTNFLSLNFCLTRMMTSHQCNIYVNMLSWNSFFIRGAYVSMWFLGIIFKKAESAESVNIDLTYDIQSFTDTGKPAFLLKGLFEWATGSLFLHRQ